MESILVTCRLMHAEAEGNYNGNVTNADLPGNTARMDRQSE